MTDAHNTNREARYTAALVGHAFLAVCVRVCVCVCVAMIGAGCLPLSTTVTMSQLCVRGYVCDKAYWRVDC